jgi:hypothetical protein
MASFSVTLNVQVYNVWVYTYRTIERGYLQGLSVNMLTAAIPIPTCYIVAGIMTGGRGDEFVSVTFFSGYISRLEMSMWTGKYVVEAYDIFFVKGRSFENVDVKIGGSIVLGDP